MIIEVLNAGLVPLLIAARGREWFEDLYDKGGLVEQITFVLLIMLFGDAVKQLTKPWWLAEKRKRLCGLKKDQDGKVINMTQAQLNEQYTKLKFNPQYQMCDTFAVITLSLTYMCLIPANLVICCIYIIVQFFIVKYWLLNHHCIPRQLDADVIVALARKLPLFVWMSVLMLFIVESRTRTYAANLEEDGFPIVVQDYEERESTAWAFFVIFTILMVLPVQRIINWGFNCCRGCCKCCPADDDEARFDEAADGFHAHYDTSNPLSHHDGSIRIYERLLRREKDKGERGSALKIAEYEHLVESFKAEHTGPDGVVRDMRKYCQKKLGIAHGSEDHKTATVTSTPTFQQPQPYLQAPQYAPQN